MKTELNTIVFTKVTVSLTMTIEEAKELIKYIGRTSLDNRKMIGLADSKNDLIGGLFESIYNEIV